MANFILKEPGKDSVLNPHQDWTFVDESKYFTFGFWTPIENTNIENGCLRILKGSHDIKQTLRVNFNFPCAFSDIKEISEKHLEDVETKKGETILLNHSVYHGSWPNMSKNTRVALSIGITHKDAQLYHHFCEDGKTVYRYKINREILEKLKYGVRPESKYLDAVFNVNFPIIRKDEFHMWLKNKNLLNV
jgi:ectoine hydroxylase-related dioxygenase (phytanoyl-CoA dioxygenase family)